MYSHAIVVSIEPFAMVSDSGDMLWTCESIDDFRALCQAELGIQDIANERWMKHCKQKNIGVFAKGGE
jgi:hypothetical protein